MTLSMSWIRVSSLLEILILGRIALSNDRLDRRSISSSNPGSDAMIAANREKSSRNSEDSADEDFIAYRAGLSRSGLGGMYSTEVPDPIEDAGES